MKKFSKIIAVLMVLVMALSFLPAAFAAGEVEVEAGKEATVSFVFENVYGVDGEFTFSNPELFSSIKYEYASSVTGVMANDKAIFASHEPFSVTLVVKCTVATDAKAGDKCDVSFKYETSDKDGNMSDWNTVTKTVMVKAAAAPQPAPAPETKIDYTELNRQLDIAAGLNEKDYTADSWAKFVEAWDAGKDALKATKQDDVDAAAKALADAIAALVRMDYSKLNLLLDNVKGLGGNLGAGIGDLINRLVAAIEAGKAALESNDQAAVDAAAKELEEVIAALKQALEELKTTETIVEKVPVEVEPTSPFCNISWHNLLLILLIISVVLNVVFIVVIVASLLKKKKNRKDTTPLVNYNIADDE